MGSAALMIVKDGCLLVELFCTKKRKKEYKSKNLSFIVMQGKKWGKKRTSVTLCYEHHGKIFTRSFPKGQKTDWLHLIQ